MLSLSLAISHRGLALHSTTGLLKINVHASGRPDVPGSVYQGKNKHIIRKTNEFGRVCTSSLWYEKDEKEREREREHTHTQRFTLVLFFSVPPTYRKPLFLVRPGGTNSCHANFLAVRWLQNQIISMRQWGMSKRRRKLNSENQTSCA